MSNNRIESDRVVIKEEGGSLKRVTAKMKEVIYTQLRDHLKQLFKGSLKMLKQGIPDHHSIKLRGHLKQLGGNLN